MDKSVAFIDIMDLITIPSGYDYPVDYTDFKVRFDVMEALRKSNYYRVDIVGVSRFPFLPDEIPMMRVIAEAVSIVLFNVAGLAVVDDISDKSLENSYLRHVDRLQKTDLFNDSRYWEFIGNEDFATQMEVDSISLEDFLDGRDSSEDNG